MHKYVVEGAEKITPSTLLLSLKVADAERRFFSFQPGQYAAISFKKHHRPTVMRCFSIVSSPTQQDILQFSMRVRGRFTTALSQIKVGDVVNVMGPYGGFIFDSLRHDEVVLIAGGIGITPFISMVRYASSISLKNKITLVCSCQNQDDIPFFDELLSLQKSNANLKIIFVIGDGPTNKIPQDCVAIGRIDEKILERASARDFEGKHYFICGPPPFMGAVIGVLKRKNVSQSNIITEAFSQGPARQTGRLRSWPANMYILSAVGLFAGTATVMLNDLLKILPPSVIFDANNVSNKEVLKNNRQADLDALVNELAVSQNPGPESPAFKTAMDKYEQSVIDAKKAAKQNAVVINIPPTNISRGSSGATTTTPAPKPAPLPKCTTSQSGVLTCQ